MATRKAREETARQERTRDVKFLETALFIFELRIPSAALNPSPSGPTARVYYPLAISPQSYSIEEPFTVSISPGTNGGLVVEENGIIQRRIRLQGTTGFAPRTLQVNGVANAKYNVAASFKNRDTILPGDLYSGLRHFQFLQDKVFRAYADLKRDPTYARETKLFLHNVKDEESWLVVPEQFSLDRGAGDGPLYRYQIQLVAVDAASHNPPKPAAPPETSWWDVLKKGVAAVRQIVDTLRGWAEEARYWIGKVAQVVQDAAQIFREVLNAINTITDFVNGVKQITVDTINQVTGLAVSTRLVGVSLYQAVTGFPEAVSQTWHNMADQFEYMVAVLKATYGPSEQLQYRTLATASSASALRSSVGSTTTRAAADAASTTNGLARAGTTPTLGQVAALLNSSNLGAAPPRINSLQSHEITSSDTLPGISLRYLGSARFWSIIAQINNLRAPYISSIPLPDTAQPGTVLLVPSAASAVNAGDESGIVRSTSDTWEVRQLFRDVKLTQSARYKNKLDLSLDALQGNRDVEYVAGIPNLVQATHTRLETKLGENVLYPTLGFPDVVGLKQPEVDAAILRLLVAQALAGDNRIQDIEKIVVSNTTSLDFYEIDISASVKGFSTPLQVETARQF